MEDVLNQIIKDDISPLFKAKGFKKKGNQFAKIFPDFASNVHTPLQFNIIAMVI